MSISDKKAHGCADEEEWCWAQAFALACASERYGEGGGFVGSCVLLCFY